MISQESLRYLAETFNGDANHLFSYKSGRDIFSFFNKYYNYHDSYFWGEAYPSRWQITCDKLTELISNGKLDDFFGTILSVSFLHLEFSELANDQLAQKQIDISAVLNKKFEADGLRLVLTNGIYRLIEIKDDESLLGSGGFADCYFIKSKNIVEKRLKAELYAQPDKVSRFKNEFAVTEKLQTLPGIIRVFSFDEKKLSYTMEKADTDLEKYINGNDLTDEQKYSIIFQILDTMSAVHAHGVIHRDLSPNNILLFSGNVKISDFGLGKDLDAPGSHQTMCTRCYGTYCYCDPHQFKELKDGDKLSDIYSIGKIINFVMTKDSEERHHIFRSAVEKATNSDKAFRYQNVDNLREALKEILSYISDKKKQKEAEDKFYSKKFDEEVKLFLSSLSDRALFLKLQDSNFRETFCEFLLTRDVFETDKQEFLSKLLTYSHDNRITFEESDAFGYLAIPLILSTNTDFTTKEVAVQLLNIPLGMNRFCIENEVDKKVFGFVEPALQEKIHKWR